MRVALLAWCPGLAAACIRGARAGGAEPVAVFTEARAPGRLAASALEGVPVRVVEQRDHEWLDGVRAADADRILVTGWRRRLPADIDRAARLGALNVHPSLLPRHRGRAPVFWTVLEGDAESGVTLHRLVDALDAGPVVLQQRVAVAAHATTALLEAELDEVAGALVARACRMGDAMPEATPQVGTPTAAPAPRRSDGVLRWASPATALERRIRACAGAIEATASWQGMRLMVTAASLAPTRSGAEPGTIVSIDDGAITVATGDGDLGLQRFVFLHRVVDAAQLATQLSLAPAGRLGDG